MATLPVMSAVIGTHEAAERLGISARQVQRLVQRDELHQPARGVLDARSVARYAAASRVPRRVPWSPETAWGAVAHLCGVSPPWLGASQRSRLSARLRALSPDELVERSRARADVVQYSAHRAAVARLRAEVVQPSIRGLGLADRSDDILDGYVHRSRIDSLVDEYALALDPEGRLTLRVTSMSLATVRDLAGRAPTLAALDLAASLDPRERSAALDALGRLLDGWRHA